MLSKALGYLIFMLLLTGDVGKAHAGEVKERSEFRVISGVAMSDKGKPRKINVEAVLRDLEAKPKAVLDHFTIDDVVGYGENNGKFWIIVSASAPPLSYSSAYTLYTYLLFYKKDQLEIHDLTTTELKPLSASKVDVNQALGREKSKENEPARKP